MAEEITNPSEELISPTEETASPSDEMTGGSSVATETKPSVSKVDMLWNALSKDDVYKNKVGSIDEFRTKMQNPEKAKMLWNALSKDEVYASKVGDEKTFLSKVSSPKSPAPSTKGGESGAFVRPITPSTSTSASEGSESESWTKTINPLADKGAVKPTQQAQKAGVAKKPNQVESGNIDLSNRPVVDYGGKKATVLSFSIGTDKGEVLIPQVVNGKVVSKDEAIKHYEKTGEHLGIFKTIEDANRYGQELHQQEEKRVASFKPAQEKEVLYIGDKEKNVIEDFLKKLPTKDNVKSIQEEKPKTRAEKDARSIIMQRNLEMQAKSPTAFIYQDVQKQQEASRIASEIEEQKIKEEESRKKIEDASGWLRTYPKGDLLLANDDERDTEIETLRERYNMSEEEAIAAMENNDKKLFNIKGEQTANEIKEDIYNRLSAKKTTTNWGQDAGIVPKESRQITPYIKPTKEQVELEYMNMAKQEAVNDMDENDREAYQKNIELYDLIDANSKNPSQANTTKINILKAQIADLTNNPKMWYDPITGKNITKPTEAAKEYRENLNEAARQIAERTTEDKLVQMFQDSYAKYMYTKKLYNTNQKFLASAIGSGDESINLDIKQAERLKDLYIKAKSEFEAVSKAYLLNRDPAGVEKTFGSLEQFFKFTGEKVAKELIPSVFTPEGVLTGTNEQFVRNIENLANDYNIELTEDQEDRFKHTFGENVTEGVVGLVGLLPKLWLGNKVAGAVEAGLAIDKAIKIWSNGTKLEKGLAFVTKGVIEEVKMQGIGFEKGVGAGFYLAHGLKIPKLSGKYGAILQPFYEKILQSSIGGTAGMEAGEIVAAAVDALEYDQSFVDEMDKLFPNLSESTKRIAEELIINSVMGLPHLKRTDFIASPDKLIKAANEMYSKGYRAEADQIKKKADQIRGYEVDTNAEIDRRIGKGGVINTEQRPVDKEKPATAEGEVVLTKNTSPTSDKYGTINRNDGKGVVDLTKEEFEAEQAKMQPKVDEQVTPTAEGEQAPKTKEEIDAEIERLNKEKEDEIREVKRTRGLIAQQTLIPEIEAKYNTQITELEKQYEKEPTKKEDGEPMSGGVQGLRTEGQEGKESAELRPEEEEVADPLKDVESTAKALEGTRVASLEALLLGEIAAGKIEGKTPNQVIAESYHKAKADGSNPELVEAVEQLLGKPKEATPTAEQKVAVEGSTVTLPPAIKGGMERTMVFKDGEWQQQVGGTPTKVGDKLKTQADEAFKASQKVEPTETVAKTEPVKEKIFTYDKDGNIVEAEVLSKGKDTTSILLNGKQTVRANTEVFADRESAQKRIDSEVESDGLTEEDKEDLKRIDSDIYTSENNIENFKNEIETEKGNLKEEKERIKQEKAKVRASSMSKKAKAEKLEELDAELEDIINDHDDLVQQYRDDIAQEKQDIKRYKKEKAKLEQKAAKAKVPAVKKITTAAKKILDNLKPSKIFAGRDSQVSLASDDYKEQNGMSTNTPNMIFAVSEADGKRIADAYDQMKHDPDNPTVKQAFNELITEIKKQADALIARGYKFQIAKEGEGYNSDSQKMFEDVRKNKRIFVDPSSKSFGTKRTFDSENIGLQDSGYKDVNGVPMTNVELIRAVHDLFGHNEFGNGFGAIGEENAWRNHMSMFTPLAQRALTATTRGQNSWVNFGKHMRNPDGSIKKKGDSGYLSPSERPFAEQKIGLLPEWATENAYGDTVTINGKKIKPVNKYVVDGAEIYEIEDAQAFYEAAKAGKESDKQAGIQVELKSVEKIQEILDKGGRLLISKDGKVGMILESNGNAGSGFKNATAEGKNLLKPLLLTAIKLGARYTDAYDTFLPEYYSKFGFKPYKRIKFNPEFAEQGWEDTILKSKPDIVVMYWDGGSRENIEKNYGKFPEYSKTQGEYTADYEGAINEARDISNSKEAESSLIPNKTAKPEAGKEGEQITTKDAVQEPSAEKEVPRTGKAGEDLTEGGEGVGQSKQGEEAPQKSEKEVIQEYVDMYDSMREDDVTAMEKREMSEKMKRMLDENPKIKRIFDNIKNINKSLEAQGLITKTKGCP